MAAGRPKKQKKDDITVVGFLILEDGRTVPFEEATEEEIQRFRANAARRLSERLSEYYTQHPEEYANLPSVPGTD